jgi:nitroreductase
MKKIIVLIAVCLFSCNAVSMAAATEGIKMKDTLTVIHARKSVRNFTGAPVTAADLDTIVRAGMAAPSAVNMQPWSFVVVTKRGKLVELADGLPHAKMLSKAGAAIIVCTEPKKAFEGSNDFAIIDASLAGENVLLAIEALGLGGVWTAAYPDKSRMKHVREVLNIPLDVIPLNVIPVGHPAGEDKPKNKYKKEKIHQEQW